MILIVGAGIGGCHLAKRLIDLGYQVQIFERDRVNRHQGLVIGLRQEAVDLLQDFQPNDLFSAESSKNLCMMGNVSCVPLLVVRNVLSVKTSGVKSGLVDRSILRNHMAKQIPVLYDKKLVRYTVGDKITLYFEDGTSYQGDILIGADGANSVVRDQFCPRLKPVEMPLWTNAGSIDIKETTNPLVQASLNALVRKSGKSGCSWLSFCYQSPTGKRMLWSISLPKDLALEYGLHSGLDPHTMRQKTILLAEKEIHPAAQQIVEATLDQDMFRGYDFSSVQTSFYDQPIESDEPVTLLGDALHKTTTQAGLGATAALQDSERLVQHLIKHGINKQALRTYEKESLKHCKQVVGLSVGNTNRIHQKSPIGGMIFTNVLWIIGGIWWSIDSLVSRFT